MPKAVGEKGKNAFLTISSDILKKHWRKRLIKGEEAKI